MKNVSILFKVHLPYLLRSYRFFDIGQDHYYYDDFTNKSNLLKTAKKSFLPMNDLLLELIAKHTKNFKVSFSISGTTLDQFEKLTPEVIASFQKLAATGNVDFVGETYSHSLASIVSEQEFEKQARAHSAKIKQLFGVEPTVFANTDLIYSDAIGEQVFDMGFKGMIAEGAKQVLGWKSPNFLYCNANNPRLKVLLRNYKLSDDVSLRFSNHSWSEYPLTADKFVHWVQAIPENEEIVNLVFDYATFGTYQPASTGIFDFFKTFVNQAISQKFSFPTFAESIDTLQPVSVLSVPSITSCIDEERDLTTAVGNNLQKQALDGLYNLLPCLNTVNDAGIIADWNKLQNSDHLYYMSMRNSVQGENPYPTHYEAFINYMNIIGDMEERIQKAPKIESFETLSGEEIDSEIEKYSELLRQLMEAKKHQKKRKNNC
ncbi:MAG: glycoside hydrolase family 57 protein [Bacteroidales bacterium]|jgi:alpha-amylase|nr:glycoside hydrolase family 57 protein [Bacteroidales bacterium]